MSDTNFTLRNSFWSKDYISGINSFLDQVKKENNNLDKEITFYSDFLTLCWSPLMKSLENLKPNNSDTHDVTNALLARFNGPSIGEIEESCLKSLQSSQYNNKEFYDSSKSVLNMHYNTYAQNLSQSRKIMLECERITKLLSNELHSTDAKTAGTVSGESSIAESVENVPNLFNIHYPYTMDERIVFETESDLMAHLTSLKESIPVQKRLISLPRFPNESFQGKLILNELKKIDAKLDTSLYNLDRLGQQFLNLKIVYEYTTLSNSAMMSKFSFDQHNYYYWNEEVFQDKASREGSKQPYGALEFSQGKDVGGNSLSEWVRRVSSNTTRTDENGEDALKRKLKVVEDQLYQKCCQLEYSKVQLEKIFFDICKKYSTIFSGTRALVKRSSNEFQRLHKVELSRQDTSSGELGYYKSNLITNFYTRENCIPFTKWQVDDATKRLVEEQMMFGVSTITADAAEAIATIVEKLQASNDAAAVYTCWQNDIDFVRVSNLKRELMKEFYNHEGGNCAIVKNMLSAREHRLNANDWVCLLKLWLLELSDSVIPSHVGAVGGGASTTAADRMSNAPDGNKQAVNVLKRHFQWLEAQGQACRRLFQENRDVPMYHFFYRDVQKDVTRASALVEDILLRMDTLAIVGSTSAQEAAIAPADPATPTRQKPVRAHSHTVGYVTLADDEASSGGFVPRPCKTSSTPGTPSCQELQ